MKNIHNAKNLSRSIIHVFLQALIGTSLLKKYVCYQNNEIIEKTNKNFSWE